MVLITGVILVNIGAKVIISLPTKDQLKQIQQNEEKKKENKLDESEEEEEDPKNTNPGVLLKTITRHRPILNVVE
jgi:hypothetical protein